MSKVAYISTYVPKRCGLATYTHHLRQSVRAARNWRGLDPVLVVRDQADPVNGADPALWPLAKTSRTAYRKAAERLNHSDVALVSLQHEFGIFGGEAGEYVLELIDRLEKPLVTTFHTVFERPEEPYRSIQQRIAERSDRIVVMSRKAIGYLTDAFGVPESKIRFIPHGTPQPIEGREEIRRSLGWAGRKVIMTFGLLGRGKGLETIIRALPAVVRAVPQTLYAIVGQTHPEVKKREGEAYRRELQELARSLDVESNIVMVDRYMSEEELVRYLTACDLYVTPYSGIRQITSGTLAYAVGLGRPVLSTPYVYAQDLLEDCEELLIPYHDIALWERRLTELLRDEDRLRHWERRMDRIGAGMRWPQVGREHLRLFEDMMRETADDRPVLKAK